MQQAQTMSVTRALVEIKSLDRKIQNAASNSAFVSYSVGQGAYKKVPNSTPEKIEQRIKSDVQSLEQLIKNRQKIKAAIVQSNAATTVRLNGSDISVAEAIELKGTAKVKREIVQAMQRQFMAANNQVEALNQKVEQSIEAAINTVYGNEKGKVDESMYNSVAKPQKEQKEAALVDPCDIQAKIKSLQDEIELLETEVDFILSESNARTVISVDLTS